MLRAAFLIIIIFIAGIVAAQPQEPKEIQEQQQFTIEREYRPILADAVKIKLNPDLPPIESSAPQLTYHVPVRLLNIPYEAPDVRPLAMKPVDMPALKNVYAKIGAGNKALPYLDIYLNSGRNERRSNRTNRLNVGAHVGYINAYGSLENQKYRDFNSKLFGTYYGEQVAFGGTLKYDRDVVFFYGYDENDTTFESSEVRQRFNFYSAAVDFKNTSENDFDLSYNGRVEYNYINDRFGHKESNPLGEVMLRKELRDNHIKATLGVDYNNYSFDTIDYSNTIVSFNPKFRLQKDIWFVDVGVNLGVNESEFYIFPDVRFERELLGKGLVFLAEIDGNIVKNNFKTLTDFNPFVDDDIILKNSRDFGVGVGFRGAPGQKFSYTFKVNYNNIRDLPLFVNDSLNTKRFDVVYDSSAYVTNLHGELSYSFSEKLRMILIGDYFNYQLKNIAEAWHLPTAKASLYLTYNITDKLSTTADLFVFNSTNARTAEGQVEQLKGLVDINLGATYKISDSFHIFANVNNIASVKHQRWYNYPSYGFNAIGGLALLF